MDEIIFRSLNGETTNDEERALDEWRKVSDANRAHYDQLVRLAQITRLLRPSLQQAVPPHPDHLLHQLDERLIGSAPAQRRGSRWISLAIGAAAVAVLAVAINELRPRDSPGLGLGAVELVTSPGETVTATLGDGSIVRLAPESRFRVVGSNTDREVWLRGRAYFSVARQRGREFRVHTDAGEAKVLGTRFDLEARNGDLQVVVVSGQVEVSARGTTVRVGPSEVGRVMDGGPPRIDRVADVHSKIDWMGRFLVFESTPLREAAAELGRRFGLRIHLRDSALGERLVSGWSANESAEETLAAICRTVGARCGLKAGIAVIEP